MEIINNEYQFAGGLSATAIADKYGCPVYVYDSAIIKRQYEKLTSAFKVPKLKINYACKALTNINILRYIGSLGAGLDTVSIQEVKLGLRAGYAPHDIIYTPNCVSLEEISEAVKLGVQINIDNLSILEQFGDAYPLHMHTGSDILDAGVFLQGAEVLFNVATHFDKLEYIDFGSGFKIDYKGDGICTDVEDLGEQIGERFQLFCESYGRELTLMFEPGKYLVSEAGYFLARVNVIKQTTSTVFAGLDSGLNHLIRPMLYDAYHKITNISKTEGRTRIYTVVGYICETDTFGINRKLTEVHEGDVLAFSNAGAYCWMMSSNYNSRYRPAEVLIHEGKDYLIRERETMDDILKNQVEVDLF